MRGEETMLSVPCHTAGAPYVEGSVDVSELRRSELRSLERLRGSMALDSF